MAITKTSENDKIEIVGKWNVQVRNATIIKEDGVELSRSFHRHVLTPGIVSFGSTALTVTDVSGEDAGVQAIFNAVMTDEVKEAFRLYSVGIRSTR